MAHNESLKIRRMFSAASIVPFSTACKALKAEYGLGEYEFAADLRSVWAYAQGDGIEVRVQARLTSTVHVRPSDPPDSLACLYGVTLLTDGREFSLDRFDLFLRETLNTDRVHCFHGARYGA